jgi:MFS family permease
VTPNTRLIAFINAAHGFTHYSLLILPTAVLAMAVPDGRFGDAYGPILALATGMFLLYGLFSLPQGWIAQRVGRPALMTLFFFGTGFSMAATALAGSPVVLAITLAATGLFAAIYHPIGTAMLVDAAGDKPGRAIGVNGVFGNLGVALAPMMTALLANAAGWRTAFLLPGIACVALGLACGCDYPLPRPSCDRERGHFPTSRATWCAARSSCCC